MPRSPPQKAPWKDFLVELFGIYLAAFSAYNIYEWYAVGHIYLHRYSEPHWVSFGDEPIYFSCLATVYVGAFLLFGVGSFISLTKWFRQGQEWLRRRK
jgi:hypothetical protein